MSPVSGVIITYNEESRIEAALASLKPHVDELLVVDSHSTDRTRELAEAMGARVIRHDFESHVKQKNVAVREASHDWILSLDADEVLSPGFDASAAQVNWNDPAVIYSFSRRNWYLSGWVDWTGWRRDKVVRLFHRSRAEFVGSWVHDEVRGEGCRLRDLPTAIYHHPYENLTHHTEKINRYTTHLSQEMLERGKGGALLKMLFDPPWKFFKMYFLEGGFLMGSRGFVISWMAGVYVFLKYAKLWEHRLPKRPHYNK